ncbi:hypothetical protein M0804_013374 [Polistes exclamans]|nr:hypothetical protein M0804_013374 [Polistes exclamans]
MSIFSELQEQGLTYFRTFDPKKELFLNWLNDFELAATMLQITDQRKVSFLLVMMKPSVYEQIRIQVHPYNPFELSYKVLTHQLEVMYSNNYGYSAASITAGVNVPSSVGASHLFVSSVGVGGGGFGALLIATVRLVHLTCLIVNSSLVSKFIPLMIFSIMSDSAFVTK